MVIAMFDEEERQQIMDEARENVRRRKVSQPPPIVETDSLKKWKADADARTAARAAAQAELVAASKSPFRNGDLPSAVDWSALDERIAQHINKALEAFGEQLGELLAEQRADTMKRLREELRELRIECAKLGSEAAELRATLASDRARVIDMTVSPVSRRN